MTHEIFISYSAEDLAVAERVFAYLEGEGKKCFMDRTGLIPGLKYPTQLRNAIEKSRVVILLFSSNSNSSESVQSEVAIAKKRKIPVITLRIEDIQPSAALEFFIVTDQWLNAFTSPLEKHFSKLLQAVKYLLNEELEIQPPTPSPSPTPTQIPSSSPPAVFTYPGSGMVNTPPFAMGTSPWILQFSTNWSGHFAVQLRDGGIDLVINQGVSAGEIYETYVYGHTGSNLYFSIQDAPSDGLWTLSVIFAKMTAQRSKTTEAALRILDVLIQRNAHIDSYMTVKELMDATGLIKEDYDLADNYLLQQNYIEGTMGGIKGHRWLTGKGIEFYEQNH